MLREIVEKIISEPIDHSKVRNAVNELYHYFNSISPICTDISKLDSHIETLFGLAVSTDAAAFCIIDFVRTRNFIIAIKQAIEDKRAIYKDQPIVVLYAGTGPSASLVLPLTTIFSAEQVQFVLLEINETSIQHLKKVINILAIQDYVIDIIQADASTYCLRENMEVDILVSETMKPALDKEPQVSIIKNLIGQCKPDVTLIPELIRIDMVVKGKSETNMFVYEPIQRLMDFDAHAALQLSKDKNKLPIFSNGIIVKILSKPANKFSEISVLTYIRLYKNVVLGYNETSLTIPFPVLQIKDLLFPVSFKIKYIIENRPRFSFEKLID